MASLFVGTVEAILRRRGFLRGWGTRLVMEGWEDQAGGGEGGEKGWKVYGGVEGGREMGI